MRSHEEVNCFTVGSVKKVDDRVFILLCIIKKITEVLARADFVIKDFF